DRLQGIYDTSTTVSIRCVKRVECGSFEKRQHISDKGEFDFAVPTGTYSLIATARGAFPYKRAELNLRTGDNVFIRIMPRIKILAMALMADGSDDIKKAPTPKYERIGLSDNDNALLEFDAKKPAGRFKKYSFAVLTFG